MITTQAPNSTTTYAALTARGRQQPPGEVGAAAERPHDERLEQPALGVAAHRAERQERRQHRAEEEDREHRQPEDVAPASVSASTPNSLAAKRVSTSSNSSLAPHAYSAEEDDAEHQHDDEDPPAQRLAEGVPGDDPPHETAST